MHRLITQPVEDIKKEHTSAFESGWASDTLCDGVTTQSAQR
jgi:hypothetical protein